MLALIRRPTGPGGRRGVTLVEMLVVVALVVLMMVILVQIFQSATGAMSASRTVQELDVNLRQVDSIIRSDLAGSTAKMTPPNDPKDKRGYFEYGENAFADAQGEDTDDWLAFTTRAPEGQVFSGRQWLAPPAYQTVQPTTINSQVAEVVYFLRNGNLYRRVFLVVPERAKSLFVPAIATTAGNFYTSIFGGYTNVSWLGMNDISCRPGGYSAAGVINPIPNDLGDLTNRENRWPHPRFLNDFTSSGGGPDGIPDDNNGDGIPDYYPTLYTDGHGGYSKGSAPNVFVNDIAGDPNRQTSSSYNIYAFPFIYPGMYSVADRVNTNLGQIHYLYTANHGPLDIGDNLPVPDLTQTPRPLQTWWGFPTWRETMTGSLLGQPNHGWSDPINFVTRNGGSQPLGLQPFRPDQVIPTTSGNLLPPITVGATSNVSSFADPNAGSANFIAVPANPNRVWEDDLLLTGVRSFDVKAYDLNAPLYNIQNGNGTFANGPFSAGYQDLGYGANSYIGGPNGLNPNVSAQFTVNWQNVGGEPQGFGHEGRIPPRTGDFRIHPRRPYLLDSNGNPTIPYNIGDDSTGVIRLTRVWDSWSTDYTNAPDSDIFLNGYANTSPAIYPSFNAPYPSPLRGIQIQIRLVDPRGEKAKSITIRHDFTDKL